MMPVFSAFLVVNLMDSLLEKEFEDFSLVLDPDFVQVFLGSPQIPWTKTILIQ